jgi:hypothetical protein
MTLLALLIYGGFCFAMGYGFAMALAKERQALADLKAEWAEWDRQHGFTTAPMSNGDRASG